MPVLHLPLACSINTHSTSLYRPALEVHTHTQTHAGGQTVHRAGTRSPVSSIKSKMLLQSVPQNAQHTHTGRHNPSHRREHKLTYATESFTWGHTSSKMSTELKSTWHLSNSELIWNLSMPGKVRATVVKLMIPALLCIARQLLPAPRSYVCALALLFLLSVIFIWQPRYSSISRNVTALATVDLIYLAEWRVLLLWYSIRLWELEQGNAKRGRVLTMNGLHSGADSRDRSTILRY